MQGFFSIIITSCTVFYIFISNKSGKSIVQAPLQLTILLFVVILLTVINYKIGVFYTRKAKNEIDKAEEYYTKKQYYYEKYMDTEFQKDLKINNLHKLVDYDVSKMYRSLSDAEYRQGKLFVERERWGGMLTGINCVLVYLFVTLKAFDGLITAGDLLIISASILQFSEQMLSFAGTLGNAKSAALFAEDYFRFMKTKVVEDSFSNINDHESGNALEVEFRHVTFKYKVNEDYVLKNVSFKFSTNEKIALVGRNGSGKTTIIKLLCGFYKDYGGEILVDGTDIKEYSVEKLWEKITAVFQDFAILDFSVKDNFFGCDNKVILESLNKAGINITDLDNKVGKTVFIDGINYSGGERQKIAIARAICKNAQIVIMDEPTAALDPVSENEVYAGFNELVNCKGGVFVSHRLSSCKFCDRILVINRGEVVQQGKHEELVNKDGLYRELWKAQSECYA